MSIIKDYKIETIEQLINTFRSLDNYLSSCNFLKDLTAFLFLAKNYPENDFFKFRPMFHWKDDNITGVTKVSITKKQVSNA